MHQNSNFQGTDSQQQRFLGWRSTKTEILNKEKNLDLC